MDDYYIDPSLQIINANQQAEEANLPEVVAGMKMLAVDMPEENESSLTINGRTLRKRKPKNFEDTSLNRRCSLRPKKRTYPETQEKIIKEYYLNKSVKRKANSLETIFEEKDGEAQNAICMSVKRFKRTIQFDNEPTDSKLRKRKEKIKRVFGSKINNKRKARIPMQALIDKLHETNEMTVSSNLSDSKN